MPEKKAKKESKAIERVPSGIPGLDGLMEGGFVKNSTVLIEGTAGSGKSILATQFIVEGIAKGEPGVYISFEEDKEDFFANAARFGWDLAELEKKKAFKFLLYQPHELKKFMESGGGLVRDAIDSIKAKRVVVDSLTTFAMLFDNDYNRKQGLLSLFWNIEKWGVTAIMTHTQRSETEASQLDLEAVVDAVLVLYHTKHENVRERAVEIFKMRGTDSANKIVPFQITNKGVKVFPNANVFSEMR